MYLGICEWQETRRDRGGEMKDDGWKDREGQGAKEGAGKAGRDSDGRREMWGNERERQKARQRRQEWSFEPSGLRRKSRLRLICPESQEDRDPHGTVSRDGPLTFPTAGVDKYMRGQLALHLPGLLGTVSCQVNPPCPRPSLLP